jgi:large subunit ribosomal protein L22
VLRSAIANATNKEGFSGDVDKLFVSACYANQGPSAKRVRPAPMGRAFRVLKRTAHLTVHVSERPQKVVAVGTTPGAEAPRPKRARAQKSATTPSKKASQKAKE